MNKKLATILAVLFALITPAMALSYPSSSYNLCYYPNLYSQSRNANYYATYCGFNSKAQWKITTTAFIASLTTIPTPQLSPTPTPMITPTPTSTPTMDCSTYPYGVCPLEYHPTPMPEYNQWTNRHDCPSMPYGLCPLGS